MSRTVVTKEYRDLPAAHRQPTHKGHCRLIHGHNWGFDISFASETYDGCGFVVDVGLLQPLKEELVKWFDHTLLLNQDDPLLETFKQQLEGYADIRVVKNCGMEGLAKFVADLAGKLIDSGHIPGKERGLHVCKVICWEDSKNSSVYLL